MLCCGSDAEDTPEIHEVCRVGRERPVDTPQDRVLPGQGCLPERYIHGRPYYRWHSHAASDRDGKSENEPPDRTHTRSCPVSYEVHGRPVHPAIAGTVGKIVVHLEVFDNIL